MATVVIDVLIKTRTDTSGAEKAKKATEDVGKAASSVSKKKHSVRLGVEDNATRGIQKVMKSAASFGKKTFKATLSIIDKASDIILKADAKLKAFTSKTWQTTLGVVDKFTTPLSKLKNMLFSIDSLVATVATGLATKLVISNPINLADDLKTAQIGFETMLGSPDAANKMMRDINAFAIETPFETMDIVNNVQQMLAMGFAAEDALPYLEKIGNTAAATGKGSEGISRITTALGQMRMKGRVSAEEMLQLTEGGVKAWDYLAAGVGKSTAEVQDMVSKGLIPVDDAIGYIIDGMGEFDGMMQKTASTTVRGLLSQIKDTFNIKLLSTWGTGLQTGAVRGLKKFTEFLERIDPLLAEAGTSLEKLGEQASDAIFGVLGKLTDRFEISIQTPEFKEADLGGKIKILWNDVIWEPFVTWWESEGKPKISKKLNEIGESLGQGLSSVLTTLLGGSDGAIEDGSSLGASFAEGFLKGFDGDKVGEALLNAIKSGFSSLGTVLFDNENATAGDYVKGAITAYGVSKAIVPAAKVGKGIYNTGKGISDFIQVAKGAKTAADVGGTAGKLGSRIFDIGQIVKGSKTAADVGGLTGKIGSGLSKIIGSTGNRTVQGTGLLNKLANVGYDALGGADTFKTAGVTGAQAAKVGAKTVGKTISKASGVLSFIDMGIDAYQGSKKSEDWLGGDSAGKKVASGIGGMIGGTGPGIGEEGSVLSKAGNILGGAGKGASIGAMIGSVVPGVGTGIGAAVGGVIGAGASAIGGERIAKAANTAGTWIKDTAISNHRKLKKWYYGDAYDSETGELDKEFAGDTGGFVDKVSGFKESINTFFTQTLPEKWNEFWSQVGSFFSEKIPAAISEFKNKIKTFFTETIPNKWKELWDSISAFFTEKIPYAIGFIAGKITSFFTETIPEKWDEFLSNVTTFVTETIPEAIDTVKEKISIFFTETLPDKWREFWDGVGEFFEGVGEWLELLGEKIVSFFTETIPTKWREFWDSVGEFITETIIPAIEQVGEKVYEFFTETIPEKVKGLWDGITTFITETIPEGLKTISDGIKTFFTETIPNKIQEIWDSIISWVSEKIGSIWTNIKAGFSSGSGTGDEADKNAAGGYIGSKTLSWLAEEGTPEMVIPLGAHRRQRGIALWLRTGEMLGVTAQKHANGGLVGHSNGSAAPLSLPYASQASTVTVNVGGVSFNISNANNAEELIAAIRQQSGELVNIIVDKLVDGLTENFENTPLAVIS